MKVGIDMRDRQGREITYMRLSLTDRCNLRCRYCMPHDVPFIPHEQILTYEELRRVCESAQALGIRRFKITGGEPLVRKGCIDFIRELKRMPGTEQVTLTTNGILLGECAEELKDIGIDGINISLDTLRRERYLQISGKDELSKVLEALDKTYELGLKVKINCVPLKGFNEDELLQLAKLSKERAIDVRFIEVMPIGYGKEYAGISLDELEQKIQREYPEGEVVTRRLGNGPARYYHPGGFKGSIGFIDAIHGKFCDRCNRVRITSEGFLKTCLYYNHGVSLRELLRRQASAEELTDCIRQVIYEKPKEHQFGRKDMQTEEETRKMSQIGG